MQRAWDDTIQNLDQHKLSPEQQVRARFDFQTSASVGRIFHIISDFCLNCAQLLKKLGRISKQRLMSALSGMMPSSVVRC